MDQTMFDTETADTHFQGPANQEAEALLNAISKAQAIIHFNLDGTILDANENFLAAVGYGLDDIKGQHHRMFVEPAYATSAEYRNFWHELGQGKFQTAEYKRLAKGGREIWIQASYNPIFDADGKPYKVVKFATDITEQKLKNADFTGQINAISKSQAVIHFNLDGTIIDANDNFLAAMGYALDEIKSQHHRMFVEPGYANSTEYNNFWRDLGQGKFQAGEYKRLAKGGREIWIQASYNPIFDMNGKPYKVVKFATDITEQKLKNADFTGQINAISKSQAVIHFNLDGSIIDANDNFLAAMGYALNEIKGQHHRIFVESDYAKSAEYADFWRELGEGKFQAAEYKRLAKGGREIWIQASYNPIFDMNGKPYKVVKFATDVTDAVIARRKKMEAQAAIAQELGSISNAIASATEQTSSAAAASEETNANVQAVAAGVEEFEVSIATIAESMRDSRRAADEAFERATTGDTATKRMLDAAQSMNGIVSMIQNIASQINLLSLNAAIEAARAGEAGRGFSVVANEVKSLANQAATATGQISGEIKGIQTVSTDVAKNLKEIQESLELVRNHVTDTSAAVDQQRAASREMAQNMQSAASAVAAINQNISHISVSTQNADEATRKVADMSKAIA